jgi:hypothetical protein
LVLHVLPASLPPQMPTGQPKSGQDHALSVHWGAIVSPQHPVHAGSVPVHWSPASEVLVSVGGAKLEPPHAVETAKRNARIRGLMVMHRARGVPGTGGRFRQEYPRSPCARAGQG